jgi:hypothetical protein
MSHRDDAVDALRPRRVRDDRLRVTVSFVVAQLPPATYPEKRVWNKSSAGKDGTAVISCG